MKLDRLFKTGKTIVTLIASLVFLASNNFPGSVTKFNVQKNHDVLNIPEISRFSEYNFEYTPQNLDPMEATANVSGRVVNSKGAPVRRAIVSVTSMQGQTRSATTNFFGYFRFIDLPSGQPFIVEVRAKRYSFSPEVINISGDIIDLTLTVQ